MLVEQDEKIRAVVNKERGRLLNFIRKRVPSDVEAEDILQDVFFQLVETYRQMKPVEQVSAWLFTVARNKIIDLFRKKKTKPSSFTIDATGDEQDGESLYLENLLQSTESGPETSFARKVVMEELEAALDDLSLEQRDVFVMHELEGMSFKQISEITGKSVNTLLSRKRYAVSFLRQRLLDVYEEFIND